MICELVNCKGCRMTSPWVRNTYFWSHSHKSPSSFDIWPIFDWRFASLSPGCSWIAFWAFPWVLHVVSYVAPTRAHPSLVVMMMMVRQRQLLVPSCWHHHHRHHRVGDWERKWSRCWEVRDMMKRISWEWTGSRHWTMCRPASDDHDASFHPHSVLLPFFLCFCKVFVGIHYLARHFAHGIFGQLPLSAQRTTSVSAVTEKNLTGRQNETIFHWRVLDYRTKSLADQKTQYSHPTPRPTPRPTQT